MRRIPTASRCASHTAMGATPSLLSRRSRVRPHSLRTTSNPGASAAATVSPPLPTTRATCERSPEVVNANDLFPKISEEGLELLRNRIGVKIENTLEPWCHEATRDNIRHYAHGIGDDNPLWCDPEYAAHTKYGTIVALPSFLFATNRIISGYVGGLSGVHAMWAGANWT